MEIKDLIAKKALYEAKQVELSLETYDEEVKKAVDEFRAQKEQEIVVYENEQKALFAAKKDADEKKVKNYLELLDELIDEARRQEIIAQENATTSTCTEDATLN